MIASVNIVVTPYREYKIVNLPAGATAYYNGQLVGGSGTKNLFVAMPDLSVLIVKSDSTLSGTFDLVEIMRNYYDPYNGQGGMWSFQSDGDAWNGAMSFRPEWMANIKNRLATFRKGKLYIHDGTPNRFYDQDFDSVVAVSHSEDGNTIKEYTNVHVEGIKPTRVHIRTEVPYVQSSDLVAADFRDKEGVHYAAIRKDRLSHNITGDYFKKLIFGDKMRGEIGKIQLVFSSVTSKRGFKFVNIGFNMSSGQQV